MWSATQAPAMWTVCNDHHGNWSTGDPPGTWPAQLTFSVRHVCLELSAGGATVDAMAT